MRVPRGPLIRVVGTEVVIPCSVSDYDGPSEQNFDWEFSQATDFLRIVSTWDSTFTSEEYQKRVGRGDIELRRSSNDAVELVIRNIQPTDQGIHKCRSPCAAVEEPMVQQWMWPGGDRSHGDSPYSH